MNLSLAEFRRQGIEVDLHYTGNLRSPLGMARAIREVRTRARGYDLAHAQFGSACAWVTSFVDIPKTVILRGSDFFGIEEGPLWMRAHGRLGRWMTFQSLDSYSRVITVSRQMQRLVAGLFPALEVTAIPAGINLAQFVPMPQAEARARLGFPDDRRRWILLASIRNSNPVKRWPLAQAACELVTRDRPDVVLKTVAGVTHDQIPVWMSAADVLLLTSTHEGWPNVVKEALACNTPFVSTDVSDLKEIADAAPACKIADPDPRALAEALQLSLSLPRPTDLRRFVEPMDVSKTVAETIALYRRLCADSAQARAA
jgi:teichuronic acid biosynthesis glycosyltransferase TuaC